MSKNMRQESDFLGEMQIPRDAYWGINTARAIKNFHITGHKLGEEHPELIAAFAYIKKACAMANADLTNLDPKKADAICKACDELIEGKLLNEFQIDVIQGGAGTSTNMAMNEIIA
ncbi:MAG: aspartate ammonia-lyase, partial [Bifidobacteriaceae bacterium]|nr:aspartate ammonia-lyase [Bifidobacteriaceae bacterium]